MRERPLSPHLQVYRWTLTMAMSILHRLMGVALCAGLAMLVWMLLAAATGESAFAEFIGFSSGIIGQLMLLGWTVALFYHAFNGIRHMCWDVGMGFEIKTARLSGVAVFVATAAATAAVWWGVLFS